MGQNAGEQRGFDFEILGDGFNDPVAVGELGQIVVEVAGGDERGLRRLIEGRGLGFGESSDCGCGQRGCAVRRLAGTMSSRRTGMPALARCAAMREPMVPAPSTAARRTSKRLSSQADGYGGSSRAHGDSPRAGSTRRSRSRPEDTEGRVRGQIRAAALHVESTSFHRAQRRAERNVRYA